MNNSNKPRTKNDCTILTGKDIEMRATAWAEEHGIVKYRTQGPYLIYNVSYPAIVCEPKRTYHFKVDLQTGKTVESRQLKRYDPKGAYNRN